MQPTSLPNIFIDSDVIISSLIASSGAAFRLWNEIEWLDLYVSNVSITELKEVVDRLNIKGDKLDSLIKGRLKSVKIDQSPEVILKQFESYVLDPDDAHIVAGAKVAKAGFLLSYDTRHFRADKLNQDFQLILMTPGLFLQYIRSLN